ncbi:MAG: succinate dehydrogenase [Rhodospirillales bacterium]|jgi:fumarate reductase subunit D|nr:succinate dehydrogenase [Rhodospirillales bacterium]MDP7651257.1 succinate dehydrogenase [Rhodospirillales bacterium]
MIKPHRNHPLWLAFLLHRLSGVCLALYLPVHFLVLGLAIDETARLGGVLRWSETLPVEMAVMGLVFLLAVHLFGGLRLLVLEFLDWHDRQKSVAAAAVALSFAAAAAFFLQVI